MPWNIARIGGPSPGYFYDSDNYPIYMDHIIIPFYIEGDKREWSLFYYFDNIKISWDRAPDHFKNLPDGEKQRLAEYLLDESHKHLK